MPSPAPFPYPTSVAETFSIGLSQPHGVAGAASTIDVVGAMPLAVREARRLPGTIWSALDIDLANLNGTAINPGVGNLVSMGGGGVNLVTRYYNDNRLVPIWTVPGSGVTTSGTVYYRRQANATTGVVTDYAYRAEATDTSYRHVMVVVGLSGYATRGEGLLVAQDAGTVATGTGTIAALTDNNGDGRYELFQVVAGTAGAATMATPQAFPGL